MEPNPATPGQTLTVTATQRGPVVATGTVDVWVADRGALSRAVQVR